ncbi:MAG: hypothetical protein J6S06_00935 [Alphaproteobacteria bacterium]|nr:hypothetical protein [Alphaproteobacteria bacterium]
MKKLTAGIFSILLGMVAVNSADAFVASKGYVDEKVGANATSIETLTQTVADNKAAAEKLVSDYKTENDAKVAKNTSDITTLTELVGDNAEAIAAQTQALATEKTAREDADKAISEKIGTVAEGKTVVGMISEAQTAATYDDAEVRGLISGNATAIEALNGGQEVQDGKILALETSLAEGGATANAIAGALADAKKYSDDQDATQSTELKAYADTAETDAVTAANSYTDTEIAKLTSTENGILKQANAYTDAEVKELADGQVKTNTDAIAAIKDAETGILKQAQDYADGSAAQALADAKVYADTAEADAVASAKTYTDGEIDKLEETLGTTSGDLTALTTRVSTAEGEIDTLQVVADTVTNAETGLAATRTVAQQGVTDAAAAQEAAEAAQTQADKGVADAAAAQAAAEAAQTTANKAIPAPTPECSDKGNKCVLVVGESGYAWEVIERGTSETIE